MTMYQHVFWVLVYKVIRLCALGLYFIILDILQICTVSNTVLDGAKQTTIRLRSIVLKTNLSTNKGSFNIVTLIKKLKTAMAAGSSFYLIKNNPPDKACRITRSG